MNLEQLKHVRAVVDTGSFNQAALKSHYSVSSISRVVKNVEKELGTELFDRNGRHLRPNEYASIICHYTDIALKEIDDALEEIKEIETNDKRKLKIFFRHGLGNTAAVLAPFIRVHPEIQMDIIVSKTEAAEAACDLEFISSKETLTGDNVIPFCDEGYVLVVGKDHPLAQRNSVHLGELRDETFIVPAPVGASGFLDAICRNCGFLPDKLISCPEVWAAAHYASQNLGVLIAAERTMLAGVEVDVSIVKLLDVPQRRHVYMRHSPNQEPTPLAYALIDYLKSYFES